MQGSASLLLLLIVVVAIQGFNIVKRQIKPTEDCTCMPYYQCNFNGTIKTSGNGIIDLRLGENEPFSNRKICENSTYVCCKDEDVNENRDGCGYRNSGGVTFDTRITVPEETQFGEFPWMVAVFKEELINSVPSKVYVGGGSLIHPRVVLTAAHIIGRASAKEVYVRAGEWDTQVITEPFPHQDRQGLTILIHPDFTPDSVFNDYALLILQTPFDIQPHINTICLPEPDDIFDTSMCISTGWGKDKFQDGLYQAILKNVNLPVIPNPTCQNMLRNTVLGQRFILDQSFMCAGGGENVDTCTGDGGGPLVCPLKSDPTRYVQTGIVAWGIGCGGAGNPGVYANVAKARAWIDLSLQRFAIDESSYVP